MVLEEASLKIKGIKIWKGLKLKKHTFIFVVFSGCVLICEMKWFLIEQMKQSQSITEQLKAENALEWTGRMNNIRVCAMEIVNKEIIYA